MVCSADYFAHCLRLTKIQFMFLDKLVSNIYGCFKPVGGTKAKRTFQKNDNECMT